MKTDSHEGSDALRTSHAELLAHCEHTLRLMDIGRVTDLPVRWEGERIEAMRDAVERDKVITVHTDSTERAA